MAEIAFTKTDFGYATADGRWEVRKVPMGGGTTGWAGGRGWSEGHNEFQVTDTHGLAQLSMLGPRHSKIVQRLYEARALIAAHTR
ncbi:MULTISPECIES: hypothetical protein [Rhodococcus erythropolis group]|jgi:hypothetical protein|uniref:Uncharacterized protein n=1 Tax=Rhodococcus baikonurensis TaxID=172041 RepID=A0ABV5XS26_9NOCA|nr:hypothetical protein [Rhodococcus qingshengii]